MCVVLCHFCVCVLMLQFGVHVVLNVLCVCVYVCMLCVFLCCQRCVNIVLASAAKKASAASLFCCLSQSILWSRVQSVQSPGYTEMEGMC